jgi:hypothetical protein
MLDLQNYFQLLMNQQLELSSIPSNRKISSWS